jgi:hypothetical protein
MKMIKITRRSRGVSMALYAMFLAFVGVPLLGATVDVTRVWLKKAELANAVEAACSAYANTPDTGVFKSSGNAVLGAKAQGEGYRLFGYNMPTGGSLTNMSYDVEEESPTLKLIVATCSGSATIRPIVLAGLVSFEVRKTVQVKAKFGTTANWGEGG